MQTPGHDREIGDKICEGGGKYINIIFLNHSTARPLNAVMKPEDVSPNTTSSPSTVKPSTKC